MIQATEHRAAGRVVAALTLAVVVGLSGVAANPTANALELAPAGSGRASLLDMGIGLASLLPQPIWNAMGQPQAIDFGGDGRLTFLVLGSDTRQGGISRTDTVMVISIENGTNAINAASIPRDTARIPNPFTPNPTDRFSGRINSILKAIKTSNMTTEDALDRFEIVIEKLLGTPSNPIEIDYHVLVTFAGFHGLVDAVDPIEIDTKQIKDGQYWDDPTRVKGVYFPAQDNYELWAWQPGATPPLCNGQWKNQGTSHSQLWCRRAMPYVRSRKGAGNSDFARAKRQQNFLGATIEAVVARGWSEAAGLMTAADGQTSAGALHTDFPYSAPGSAIQLFNRLANAQLAQQVVFGPKTYATHIAGGTGYELKLEPVRAWADAHLR